MTYPPGPFLSGGHRSSLGAGYSLLRRGILIQVVALCRWSPGTNTTPGPRSCRTRPLSQRSGSFLLRKYFRGSILPAVRQKLHLSSCADFRDRLWLRDLRYNGAPFSAGAAARRWLGAVQQSLVQARHATHAFGEAAVALAAHLDFHNALTAWSSARGTRQKTSPD
jgi:hypothetical protein